jgi:hypothetical protein
MTPPTNDSPTLFFLVSAMLVYRTIDLLATRVKLEQLRLRATWWRSEAITLTVIRGAVRASKQNAREVLFHVNILMRIHSEFIAGMMVLYLAILAGIGYAVLLWDVRDGSGASFVVAMATATVSLLTSALNFEIEKVKIYL